MKSAIWDYSITPRASKCSWNSLLFARVCYVTFRTMRTTAFYWRQRVIHDITSLCRSLFGGLRQPWIWGNALSIAAVPCYSKKSSVTSSFDHQSSLNIKLATIHMLNDLAIVDSQPQCGIPSSLTNSQSVDYKKEKLEVTTFPICSSNLVFFILFFSDLTVIWVMSINYLVNPNVTLFYKSTWDL